MRVSVVIPALNESLALAASIASAWQAGAHEVVVAPGASCDDTADVARREGARLAASPSGRARQQNAAAAVAEGDVLLFLHADNRLAPAAIDQVREALVDPGARCGAFRQRIEAEGWAYRWLEWGNARRVRWWGIAYGDQAIFVRRGEFQAVGGFADVPLMEDLLLMRTLRRRSRPRLLPGPLYVSPRRWQRHGVLPQTLRNWTLLAAFHLGVPPARLAAHYPTHRAPPETRSRSRHRNGEAT